MKKMLFGGVALAAMLASPAMAADMGVPRTFAPPPPSWTGFYVGGNFGGVWGNTDPGFIAGCPPSVGAGTFQGGVIPNLPSATCFAPSSPPLFTQVGTQPFHNHGWEGGGQIGFNYQYQWAVFGIEADLQSFRPKGSQTVSGIYPLQPGAVPCSAGFAPSGTGGCQFGFSQNSDGKWLATVRGKVGAVWGNWLVYGTMGVAWARMSFTSNFADATAPALFAGVGGGLTIANLANSFTVTETKVGVVGGAGLSYMLTRNWILSVEYLRAEIWGVGGDTLAVTTATCTVAGCVTPPGFFNQQFHYDTTFIENIVRAKLDYKF